MRRSYLVCVRYKGFIISLSCPIPYDDTKNVGTYTSAWSAVSGIRYRSRLSFINRQRVCWYITRAFFCWRLYRIICTGSAWTFKSHAGGQKNVRYFYSFVENDRLDDDDDDDRGRSARGNDDHDIMLCRYNIIGYRYIEVSLYYARVFYNIIMLYYIVAFYVP